MKLKRIISTMLAVVMLSTCAVFTTGTTASAADYNTSATATVVSANSTNKITWTTGGNYWLKFTATKNGVFTFSMPKVRRTDNAYSVPMIYLYSSNASTQLAYCRNETASVDKFTLGLRKGTYFIKIYLMSEYLSGLNEYNKFSTTATLKYTNS